MLKTDIKKIITSIYPYRYFFVGVFILVLIQILIIQITVAQKKSLEISQPISVATIQNKTLEPIDMSANILVPNTITTPIEVITEKAVEEPKEILVTPTPTPSQKSTTIDTKPVVNNRAKVISTNFDIQKYNLFQDTNPQLTQLYQNIDNSAPYKSTIEPLLSYPQSKWFGNWNSDIENDIRQYVTQANKINQLPAVVLYNIPLRDCFSYSSGGLGNAQLYRDWINKVSQGIGNNPVMIILEPDATALTGCLSQEKLNERFELLTYASKTLSKEKVLVYIDAGHSNWISAQEMSERLTKSGIQYTRGFSLNVSNFESNENNISYASQINNLFEQKKSFVIDTSRNGKGRSQNGDWCNPFDVTFGDKPQIQPIPINGLLDAFLWVKNPAESDGTCNGGPSAGSWWPEYLITLAKNKIL